MSKGAKMLAIAVFMIATALVCVFLDLSWVSSAKSYTLQEIIDTLLGHGSWGSDIIIKEINAPRVVAGLFVGAGLAVCGSAMQAVFRNPLASPYILGLSSGASLGAAISMMFAIPFIPVMITTPSPLFR